MSADIVGSTALKQSRGPIDISNIKKHYAWFSVIQGFYIEVRRAFLQEWESASSEWSGFPECFGEAPKLWKTIGDEVVFEKVLTDHRQLAVTLQCWIRASSKLREFVKIRNESLDIKCAAWLAGFPIRNKEVVLSYSDALTGVEISDYNQASGTLLNAHYDSPTESDLSIDYIGPSVDIGFRISAHSSPRKFVLSVGIPYILSLTSPTQGGMIGDFPIFYDGSKFLKGVLGGVNYPIFWIDMSEPDSIDFHEDKLTGSKAAARDDIRRFCDSFYEQNAVYTHRPFIVSDTEQQISSKPDWWDELHGNLVKTFHLADISEGAEPADANLEDDKPVSAETWPETVRTFAESLRALRETLETRSVGEADNKD